MRNASVAFVFVLVLAAMPAAARASSYACSEEVGRGLASWYGPGFDGALTKNEEVFDSSQLSAAHPSLPFGTILKVMNMRNHKSVTVRINDRGAFSKERVIDLSRGAAERLGMIRDGVAAVALFKCNQ